MPEAVALLIVTPLLAVTLIALFVVMGAIFPRQIAAVRSTGSAMPGRSFVLGLINVVFLSVISAALSWGGDLGQLLALLIFILLVVGLIFGLAGLAPMVGQRLLPESSETRQTTWGATLMVIASFTPFIGWFLLFPYLSFRGTRAFILSLFIRSPR